MSTQVGVKQLTDFLRTVTAASDLVDCTLVNCDKEVIHNLHFIKMQFYKTLSDLYIQEWHSKVTSSSKGKNYNLFKIDVNFENLFK